MSDVAGIDERARQRILVGLLDLDSRVHEELSKPLSVRPPSSRGEQFAGWLILLALFAFACAAGAWGAYWLT